MTEVGSRPQILGSGSLFDLCILYLGFFFWLFFWFCFFLSHAASRSLRRPIEKKSPESMRTFGVGSVTGWAG